MTRAGTEYGKKCILAVDDAAIILSRITDALGEHYNVVTVNSGARALKYLDKNKPDLILLDIRMPLRDGFEILREIQTMEDRADIPVVMLTGMEGRRSVTEGIKLGARDHILSSSTRTICSSASNGSWIPKNTMADDRREVSI